MRGFLKILIPCILLALVLTAAKYMDSGKFVRKPVTAPANTTAPTMDTEPASTPTWETTPAVIKPEATEPVQTEPEKTEPVETETEETEPVETEPAETEPMKTEPEETEPEETEPEETEPEDTEPTQPQAMAPERTEDTFLFTFVGDCTFGSTPSNYYARISFPKTVGSDYLYPFKNVYSYLAEDDFTMLNLEGPLTDKGNPRDGKFVFRGPTEYVNILTQNSVEAVSLSNNHIMDYGKTGYDSTCSVLDEAGVAYVEQDSIRVITLDNGLTVGLYATMYTKVDKLELNTRIKELKDLGVDVIIYAPHWGTEGSYTTGEEQQELAHIAIDAGANIVYGSHPHVLQPIEEYNGGLIIYSMGNFSFGGNTQPRDLDTALVQQELIIQEDGGVLIGERTIVPCSISSDRWQNNYQPTPYEPGTHEYERVLKKLSGTYNGANLPVGEQ